MVPEREDGKMNQEANTYTGTNPAVEYTYWLDDMHIGWSRDAINEDARGNLASARFAREQADISLNNAIGWASR
jgi:hypothetical protein